MAETTSRGGLRRLIIHVLFYSAVAVMPASVAVVYRDVEYPFVQDFDGPVPDLDELVAELASSA